MEFIIVAPLMLIMISMILQFSQIWIARHITAYAAFCAARSVLSAGSVECATGRDYDGNKIGDGRGGAQKAAELACAWMCLAGLPSSFSSASPNGSSEEVSVYKTNRLHAKATSSGDALPTSLTETFYKEDGAGVAGEVYLPGWGRIPGSDSRHVRVSTEVQAYDSNSKTFKPLESSDFKAGNNGEHPTLNFVRVKVEFKFPLIFPLAGRMISWFVYNDREGVDESRDVGYGTHNMSDDQPPPGWTGTSAVMNESGSIVQREGTVQWGSEGRFPVITLTEYCMLPMPYSVEKGFDKSYAQDLVGGL